MPDCRKPLVVFSEAGEAPKNVIVGEMAHIVGETNSENSPRGISALSEADRNRYSNLILLCGDHHTLIDKDEVGWPVERLHAVKREHELWVEAQLGGLIEEELQVYHDFIDRVALAFDLENWEWLCDCLFRQIVPVNFPDGVYQLRFEHFRAIMPGRDPAFESTLANLILRSHAYIEHYLSDAVSSPGDPRIMARRRYRDVPEGDHKKRDELLQEHNKWDRNCTMLLFNCVYALNEFADAVRKNLRPTFFIRKGKFCVHDFMGLMGGSLLETWHLPERYFSEEELNAPVDREAF
jgi:hypothetical protein